MKIRICELLKKYLGLTVIISAVVGGIISWGLSWVLPSQDVTAANIPKKELTCTLDYSYSLLSKNASDSKLQISYGGNTVNLPFVCSITIENTGEYAITNEDFKDNFSMEFVGSKQIVNAQIVESTNKQIFDELLSNAQFDGIKLTITDFYLNIGESFTIYVITDGKPDTIHYSSRISGISELVYRNTQKEKHDNTLYLMSSILCIIILVSIVFMVYMFWQNRKLNQKYSQILRMMEVKVPDKK